MDPQVLAVGIDPVAQARPLAQQRLVRELHAARADCEQAGIGEQVDHDGNVATTVLDLLAREPAPLDPALDLHLGQPQEHGPGDGLLRVVEPAEAVLGKARDRAAHPAGVLVR